MDAVDHVVLGAGAVGMAVAEALARRGESVRVVSRSGLREPVVGVQSVAGDVTDLDFAAWSTRGARVVYDVVLDIGGNRPLSRLRRVLTTELLAT
jgi:nucleoside-diphosphate-sugar epimerase